VKKFFRGFAFAFEGVVESVRGGLNMKFHVFAALCVIILSFLLGLSALEWCIIFLCIGCVIAAELMNTALEHTVDFVSKEYHPLAKKAKDAAAGAVLIISIVAFIIACILFIPKLIVCLNTYFHSL